MTFITTPVKKQIYLLLIFFTIYLIAFRFCCQLPHWDVPAISFFNFHLYFIIFILSLFIYVNDEVYPFIYLNFAIMSLIYFMGLIVIFVGNDYVIGDDTLLHILWTYRKVLISLVTLNMVVFISTSYILKNIRICYKYIITFAVIIPTAFLLYKNIILNWRLVLIEQTQYQVLSSTIWINFLCIFYIALYGFAYFSINRPNSGHINLITVGLLVFLFLDSCDNYFLINEKALPVDSHFFLLLNLFFFVLILLHKFLNTDNDFLNFYEKLIESKIKLKIKVIRRKTWTDKAILFLKKYFKPKQKKIFFILLMIISLAIFLYIFPFGATKINILLLAFILIVLVLYLNLLVNKKMIERIISDK